MISRKDRRFFIAMMRRAQQYAVYNEAKGYRTAQQSATASSWDPESNENQDGANPGLTITFRDLYSNLKIQHSKCEILLAKKRAGIVAGLSLPTASRMQMVMLTSMT